MGRASLFNKRREQQMSTSQTQLAIPPQSTATPVHASETVKPGTLFSAQAEKVSYRQHFVPATAHLEWLSCGEYTLPAGARSGSLCQAEEESLLFMWKGAVTVEVGGQSFALAPYDTLYIPRGAAFRMVNAGGETDQQEIKTHPMDLSTTGSEYAMNSVAQYFDAPTVKADWDEGDEDTVEMAIHQALIEAREAAIQQPGMDPLEIWEDNDAIGEILARPEWTLPGNAAAIEEFFEKLPKK